MVLHVVFVGHSATLLDEPDLALDDADESASQWAQYVGAEQTPVAQLVVVSTATLKPSRQEMS